jgi:hypothetical protein
MILLKRWIPGAKRQGYFSKGVFLAVKNECL